MAGKFGARPVGAILLYGLRHLLDAYPSHIGDFRVDRLHFLYELLLRRSYEVEHPLWSLDLIDLLQNVNGPDYLYRATERVGVRANYHAFGPIDLNAGKDAVPDLPAHVDAAYGAVLHSDNPIVVGGHLRHIVHAVHGTCRPGRHIETGDLADGAEERDHCCQVVGTHVSHRAATLLIIEQGIRVPILVTGRHKVDGKPDNLTNSVFVNELATGLNARAKESLRSTAYQQIALLCHLDKDIGFFLCLYQRFLAIDMLASLQNALVELKVGGGDRQIYDVVLTTKGCHPNFWRNRVHAFDLSADLFDSLAKMKTDYIDVYYLHRDDIHTTVAELMDELNWHYKEGRIKAFGAANWSYERIAEANAYARANGLQPMVIAEEHYSIAEQINDPFRQGSGTVSGPKNAKARKWFVENNIPIASYSCLSGGFLSGRVTREQFEADPESVHRGMRHAYCYDINFRRLERVEQLAKEKGCSVAQIALAYTMSGELDVFPIIGARTPEEVQSCVEALDIHLTQAECDWLDLTSDER